MDRIVNIFRLRDDTEDAERVLESVERDVVFRGTNLWILVFAIFIASLGLNVNSTAVVIGAMLVSPLMGPIMGLGFGMAINDLALLKKAGINYGFAFVTGLVASTIYFSLSPLKDASAEILARTSPNIYDVLIAIFGGFAGILAVSARNKGNVIPGVAIATALMPPLCTAGYGLANWNLPFLFGAIYLFVINTVFIAFATLVTARFLGFPYKHLPERRDEVFARRIVWVVVLITLLPSIYFGYDIVKQNRFRQRANRFVDTEATLPNNYLLKRTIDAKAGSIGLIYGGEYLPDAEIDKLKAKLHEYGLDGAKLDVRQGFSYLKNGEDGGQTNDLTNTLSEKEKDLEDAMAKLAAAAAEKKLREHIFAELKAQYPSIEGLLLDRMIGGEPSGQVGKWSFVVDSSSAIAPDDQKRIVEFLKARLGSNDIAEHFDVTTGPKPSPTG